MLERFRDFWKALMTPGAIALQRLGVHPDAVTWAGAALAVIVSLWLVPSGVLWPSALILTAIVLSDGLDGELARRTGKESSWGAFLDSSLDRVADGAIFGSVVLYFGLTEPNRWWATVAVAALVVGQLTSYVKARAEASGWTCRGGLAARADRFFILFLGMLLHGLGVPLALPVALIVLVVLGGITVGQRMAQARRQSREAP